MKKLDELRKLIDEVENEHYKAMNKRGLSGFKYAISRTMDLFGKEDIHEETLIKVIRYLNVVKEEEYGRK